MKLNKTSYILVAVVIVLLLVLVALAIACVALVSQDISDSSTSVSSGGDPECSPNPCQNGGICIDGVASHNCSCKAGFDGPNCENNIDDCSPNPCQNGGTCIDVVASHNCTCNAGFYGTNCENKNVSNDCSTLRKDGLNTSGIYRIFVQGINGPIDVYCDMVTDDGGWNVIQRRIDGSLDFYLDWNSYKMGFGTLSGEFWLGNDKIHHLTANGNTVLRVELEDWNNNTACAVFGLFMVDDESKKYKLTVGNYSGTAGDSLKAHNGMFFTTKDRDNDKKLGDSCAVDWKGAWWYHSCYNSNLNGQYLGNTVNHEGIVWYDWKSNYLSLKRSTMMIRRRL